GSTPWPCSLPVSTVMAGASRAGRGAAAEGEVAMSGGAEAERLRSRWDRGLEGRDLSDRRRRAIVAVVAMAFASLAMVATARPARAATTVSTCDEPTLDAAIAAGGTVTFACSGTITLTHAITIGAGANVTLDASGATVRSTVAACIRGRPRRHRCCSMSRVGT